MQVAEPVAASWKPHLSLQFPCDGALTILAESPYEEPFVVQNTLYPDGPERCHAIVVHPPGGIAGGDDLRIDAKVEEGGSALLTTPGAAKWYRSAGTWARQRLAFEVQGSLEWLPRETIVFDGALADLRCDVALGAHASFIGWEVVSLGRFARG